MASNTAETSKPSPRPRRARKAEPTGNGAQRRARRPRPGGETLLADLTQMVDRLIQENRELKRTLDRVQKAGVGVDLGPVARTLTGLQRRVSRALAPAPAPRRRGAPPAPAAPAAKPRRKVTDPEVLERRRQALAKARAARQAKREAARQ